jgi:hypothetical protein
VQDVIRLFLRSDAGTHMRVYGITEGDGVADSQVHSLTTSWRMHVGGIPHKQDLPTSNPPEEGTRNGAPDPICRRCGGNGSDGQLGCPGIPLIQHSLKFVDTRVSLGNWRAHGYHDSNPPNCDWFSVRT